MRWLKWCGKMVITVVLVSTLTLLTTGLIVQSYVTSLLAEFNIAWEGQPAGLTSIFKSAVGLNTGSRSEANHQKEETISEHNTSAGQDNTSSTDSSNHKETDAAGNSGIDTENNESDEGAIGTENAEDPLVMSPEDMVAFKDTIPDEEKTEVFDLLMKKIPTNEMQNISSAMEGGITEQELQDMEQVIAKYLTEEEYKQLMAILTPAE